MVRVWGSTAELQKGGTEGQSIKPKTHSEIPSGTRGGAKQKPSGQVTNKSWTLKDDASMHASLRVNGIDGHWRDEGDAGRDVAAVLGDTAGSEEEFEVEAVEGDLEVRPGMSMATGERASP
jgi:hypothetical protein